jgi:hypothetical protein
MIITKYLGPTNHRGARVKARCASTSIIVPWDYSLDVRDNHIVAFRILAKKLHWVGDNGFTFISSWLPDSAGMVFVHYTPAHLVTVW